MLHFLFVTSLPCPPHVTTPFFMAGSILLSKQSSQGIWSISYIEVIGFPRHLTWRNLIPDTKFDQIVRILPFLFSSSLSSENLEANYREPDTRLVIFTEPFHSQFIPSFYLDVKGEEDVKWKWKQILVKY